MGIGTTIKHEFNRHQRATGYDVKMVATSILVANDPVVDSKVLIDFGNTIEGATIDIGSTAAALIVSLVTAGCGTAIESVKQLIRDSLQTIITRNSIFIGNLPEQTDGYIFVYMRTTIGDSDFYMSLVGVGVDSIASWVEPQGKKRGEWFITNDNNRDYGRINGLIKDAFK